jgi:Caudovirus prohead serine protease
MAKSLAFGVDSSTFNFFLPLSKVKDNKDGTCTVSGYASTPALDLDGEVVSLDAVRKALPGYWEYRNIREMHTNSAVGVAKEANIDEKGLFLTSRIVDRDAVQKCLEGVYKGYSIGGKKLAKNGNTITDIELIEVSIVDRPANPECCIDVAKQAKTPGATAYLMKARAPRSPQTRALAKMAQAVEALAKEGPPAAHDGFSLPAEKIADPPSTDTNLCSKHNLANCAKCAAKAAKKAKKVAKREVSRKERTALASSGAALPNGSFPIANRSDLSNARQAVGRAKNPGVARAHIKQRATALGVTLPDSWSKKLAKSLIASAEASLLNLVESAQPSFLSLDADGERGDLPQSLRDDGRLGHDNLPAELTLGKGGPKRGHKVVDDTGLNLEDFSMSAQTNNIDPLEKFFKDLNKAGGRMPSRFQRMNDARGNLKKARKMRGEAEEAIKAAHGLLKAAYLAKKASTDSLIKAGKKPNDGDADDMDTMGKVMSQLNKAFGSTTTMKTFMKAADVQLKKSMGRSGQRGQETSDGNEFYQVPAGVKDLSPSDLSTAGPGGGERGSEPYIHGMEQPIPGKAAKGGNKRLGYVTAEVAELIAKAAAAEAKVEVLERMPAAPSNGRRPVAFDVTKLGIGSNDEATSLFKGVDPTRLASNDENTHTQEVAKVFGNMILGGRGKSVFDPGFHGTAGAN